MVLNPISHEVLRTKLNEGTVQFAFKKLNGDLRIAIGTTDLELVPLDHHPQRKRKASQMAVPYFDLSKNQWRSVSTAKEIFIAE